MLHKLPLLERLTWHVHTVHCPRGGTYTHLSIPFWKDGSQTEFSYGGGKYIFTVVCLIMLLLSKWIRKGLNPLHRSYISLDYSTDSIALIPRWNVANISKTLVSMHPPKMLEMNTSDLSMVFVKPGICQVAATFKVTHKWLYLYFCSMC